MTKLKLEGVFDWARWFGAILVYLAVFGGFTAGLWLNVPILSWLPLIVHQISGWTGIALTILITLADIFGWRI